jgi:hypothetical protein
MVRSRYEAWSSGSKEERTTWFAVYNSAIDREESAARRYAESIEQLRRFLWPDLEADGTTTTNPIQWKHSRRRTPSAG